MTLYRATSEGNIPMTAEEEQQFLDDQAALAAQVTMPKSVSARQAEQALILSGLDDDVDALLAAMPGVEGKLARAERARAQTVERNNPLVAQMAAALGLSDTDLDQLFILAATL